VRRLAAGVLTWQLAQATRARLGREEGLRRSTRSSPKRTRAMPRSRRRSATSRALRALRQAHRRARPALEALIPRVAR
jgi:hypothetical protein